MNLTVNSQHLATELRLANKIVPTKPSIPILSHALLTADDQLRFWSSDLEVGLSSSCPAQVAEPGAVALPVARLLSLVEQFADAPVIIATDKQHVTIACGAFKSRLQAMPTEDFPQAPPVEGVSSTLDGAALRQLIARTRYAINDSSSKYILKGALLTLSGPVAAMVATDGHRLALATAQRSGADARVLLPAKTLDVLSTHLAAGCELTVGERHLFFASGGRLLVSRTMDGQFPAYERIIPRDNANIATIDRAALTAALRRVTLVSEENKAVYLALSAGQLAISSSSAEIGSADEAITAQYDGPPLKVCINGGYVLDFLNVAAGQAVTMALKDAQSAALFSDGDDHVAVVMLMRG